jgi:hypothetical protein
VVICSSFWLENELIIKKFPQTFQDAHNAFGKELAEYIMKCEDGRGSSQTQIPKNFGPFYILAGAYPGQLING